MVRLISEMAKSENMSYDGERAYLAWHKFLMVKADI